MKNTVLEIKIISVFIALIFIYFVLITIGSIISLVIMVAATFYGLHLVKRIREEIAKPY